MVGKKGMGKLEVGGIVLFIIIGFLILFQSLKLIDTGQKVGSEEACRSSVQASASKVEIPFFRDYDSKLRINCPKNYIEVTNNKILTQHVSPKSRGSKQTQSYKDENNKPEEIGSLIAAEMKNCWKKYGSLSSGYSLHEVNVDEADHDRAICFECSNIVFNTDGDELSEISINVHDYLDSLKTIESGETTSYYEYITGVDYGERDHSPIIIEGESEEENQWSVLISSLPPNVNWIHVPDGHGGVITTRIEEPTPPDGTPLDDSGGNVVKVGRVKGKDRVMVVFKKTREVLQGGCSVVY